MERARWLEAEAGMAAEGSMLVLRNDKGEPKSAMQSPFVAISDRAKKAFLAAWREIAPVSAVSRPTILHVAGLLAARAEGLAWPLAADKAGVPLDTLRLWLDSADSDPHCAAFAALLRGATVPALKDHG